MGILFNRRVDDYQFRFSELVNSLSLQNIVFVSSKFIKLLHYLEFVTWVFIYIPLYIVHFKKQSFSKLAIDVFYSILKE